MAGVYTPKTTSPKQSHTKRRRLLRFAEVPEWYGPNEFILTGYRAESNSTIASLHSWAYLHNETCNIYSHLIPTALCFAVNWYPHKYYLPVLYPSLNSKDAFVLTLQLSAAIVCMGTSSIYHTLMNHSPHIANRWLLCDYMGIVILILGDFISGIYFGFYCETYLKLLYWGMILALGSLTAVILLNPRFQGPEWRTFRLATFICTCLSAFAPMAHAAMLFGLGGLWQIGVPYYLAEGAVMVTGVYFYERQIPERWYPGKFDIWGHSHTIFHILVVLGTCIHVFGLMRALDYNHMQRGECHF